MEEGREVLAFFPGSYYPTISLTGRTCSLRCGYCAGKYLEGMIPVRGPGDLFPLARRLAKGGARGLLLSGGSDLEGRLPIRPFLPEIGRVKRELDLFLSVHPGLVDRELASAMRR